MDMKVYPIKDSQDYFRTGISSADGTQALCARQTNRAICLKFSMDGRFLGLASKLLSNQDNDEDTLEEIGNWLRQLGFHPGTIHVQKFVLPELTAEIKDMPDYLQEYVDSPSKFSEDRREDLSRCIGEWQRAGGYVLIWNEEYEMNAEGDVEST